MADFNRSRGPRDNNRFGSRQSFDRPRFGGGRDGGNRQMHTAVCAQCGKDCQVPFRPREDKPVYCSDCFEKKGGRDSQDEGRNRFERPSFHENNNSDRQPTNSNQYKQDFDMLNAKLDKIMRLLTPVENPKPVIESVSTAKEPTIEEVKPEKKKTVRKVSPKKTV